MSEEVEVEAAQGPVPMEEDVKLFALLGRLAKLTRQVLDSIPASPSEDDELARSELAQDLADVAEACGVDPTI